MPALVLALLAVPAIEAPAPRAEAAARAFLQSIYRACGPHPNWQRIDHPERYFEPVLAAAIRKDQDESEKRGDMIQMSDPFCYHKDFDGMSNPVIGAVRVKGARATTIVRYALGKESADVRLTLVLTREGWRIFEMSWMGGGSLRERYFPER